MGIIRKFLIVTNPLTIVTGVGILGAVVLKNLLGGVTKDMIEIVKDI